MAKRIKQSNDFAEIDFAALVALGLEPVIAALRIGKTTSFSAEQLKEIFAAITLPNPPLARADAGRGCDKSGNGSAKRLQPLKKGQ